MERVTISDMQFTVATGFSFLLLCACELLIHSLSCIEGHFPLSWLGFFQRVWKLRTRFFYTFKNVTNLSTGVYSLSINRTLYKITIPWPFSSSPQDIYYFYYFYYFKILLLKDSFRFF